MITEEQKREGMIKEKTGLEVFLEPTRTGLKSRYCAEAQRWKGVWLEIRKFEGIERLER